jgi:glutaredoxin-like YruB-family protein
MENVNSYQDLKAKALNMERSFLLLYKPGSEKSDCAIQNLESAVNGQHDTNIYTADVTIVRDIHPVFGIETVPALLVFTGGRLSTVIKGCQDAGYYRALTENTLFRTGNGSADKGVKNVTVYSTPTCTWCNTLKEWLRKNNISYTDVDISRDQLSAEALVRRSGQQGVPQTDINGQIVVGFNQPELKRLLEIQ